jgi:hypothetical protein
MSEAPEYIAVHETKFDAHMPMRTGPMLYVGTTRRFVVMPNATAEDFAAAMAHADTRVTIRHVRADDVRQCWHERGYLQVTVCTHELPSASPYSHAQGVERIGIDCTPEQYEAFVCAIGGINA